MHLTFRELDPSDAPAASALSLESFERFVAPDWSPSASDEYRSLIASEVLTQKIEASSYTLGAFNGQRLVGFLLMPRTTLIQIFFIDPDWVRQGVGRRIWQHARSHIETHFPDAKTIELNSSPYARDFYRRLGFVPISAEYQSSGFRATRMACWLPARELGAELPQDGILSRPGKL